MLFRGKITHTHTPQYCITVILYGRAFHKERQPRFKIISKYYLLRSVIRIENEKKNTNSQLVYLEFKNVLSPKKTALPPNGCATRYN